MRAPVDESMTLPVHVGFDVVLEGFGLVLGLTHDVAVYVLVTVQGAIRLV